MLNLLPPKYKEQFSQEENLKMILILSIVFLVALISFSLILLSIKIYIQGELKAQEILLSEKELESSPSRELEEKLKSGNFALSQLDSFYQKNFSSVEILEKIFQTLPPKTYLTSLNLSVISKKEGNFISVSLAGYSPTRETLLEFKKNLESQGLFEKISFPPSNWIKSVDIDFAVNFQIPIK